MIRLIATIRLKTDEGWTREYDTIVDTGNPISLIPFSIWNKARVRLLLPDKTKLYGIGTGEKTSVSGRLAEVIGVFQDQQKILLPLRIKAYVLEDDSAPLLIGFEDILTDGKLVSDYKSREAYLEM
ncbi:MAG: hypothetical protein QME81_18900 [bacterium]|nr:hypothetical protein [bacterium]